MMTTQKSYLVTILAILIITNFVAIVFKAAPASALDIINKTEINANAVGCSEFKIVSADAEREMIQMTVKIDDISSKDRNPSNPCVCGRSERYYISVYPRDEIAAPDSVWATSRRSFVQDFPFGRLQNPRRTRKNCECAFSIFSQ